MNRNAFGLVILCLIVLKVKAGILPGIDNLKEKLEGLNGTAKASVLTDAFNSSKEYVKEKLNNTIIAVEDYEDEGPIDPRYFDDIYRIINHLDFDEVTPRAVNKSEVTYYLYTRQNRKSNGTHQVSSRSIQKACGYKNKNVYFLTHGWRSNNEGNWVKNITDAFLDLADVAVIQVDWRAPASDLYAVAVLNVPDVGHILGDFILELREKCGYNLQRINLIGHSLGAHVSGFAGKRVINQTNDSVAKLIALDPAGPLFRGKEEDSRLSKNDAKRVFVLHTDGGKFGYEDTFGAADFFPNGGTAIQPGCLDLGALSIKNITSAFFCSHARSHRYFLEMLKDNSVAGVKCETYLTYKTGTCDRNEEQPFFTDKLYRRGEFFFTTNSLRPFFKSKKRARD